MYSVGAYLLVFDFMKNRLLIKKNECFNFGPPFKIQVCLLSYLMFSMEIFIFTDLFKKKIHFYILFLIDFKDQAKVLNILKSFSEPC